MGDAGGAKAVLWWCVCVCACVCVCVCVRASVNAATPYKPSQTARLYDATGAARGVFVHPAPLLDCCFEGEGVFYTGGLDCRVTR